MTSSRNHSTVRSRELGAELRRLRRAARLSGQSVVDELGVSLGWLSKLETGARGTSELELGTLLGFYRAPQETRRRVAYLLTEGGGSVVRLHRDSPDELAVLSSNTEVAVAVKSYDPLTVPWPVQTEAYANAVTGSRVAALARMEQQATLFREIEAPTVTVYVPEAFVLHPVASPQVMREQLMRLTLMCGWKHVNVHAVPQRPVLDRMLRQSATLLELRSPQFPVVYEESGTAAVFHDDPEVVSSVESKFRRLARLAVSPDESRSLFAQWTERFRAGAR